MHQQWTKEHENKDKSSQISVDDKLYVHVLHVQVLHWNNSETSTTDTRFIFNEMFISPQSTGIAEVMGSNPCRPDDFSWL